MKRFVFFVLVMAITMSVFAQVDVPEYTFASGSWRFIGSSLYQTDAKAGLAKVNFKVPQSGIMLYNFNLRYEGIGSSLYQTDAKAGLAKVNFKVPQSGIMLYSFNLRYEGGGEDGHGGVGIHIFMDNAINRASWGAGRSYLLWLNYDKKPLSKDIPVGLSAQVYKSISNSQMDLIASVPLTEYEFLLTEENLAAPITFRIIANGDTGEIRIYDPTDPENKIYFIFIDKKDLPLKGNYVALRTNGIKLSFALEDAGK